MKAAFAAFNEHTFVGKWSGPGRFAGCRWWRLELVLPASLRLQRPPPPSPARWSPGRSWSSPRWAAHRRASVYACVWVQPVLRTSKSQRNPISEEHKLLGHSRAFVRRAETAAALRLAVAVRGCSAETRRYASTRKVSTGCWSSSFHNAGLLNHGKWNAVHMSSIALDAERTCNQIVKFQKWTFLPTLHKRSIIFTGHLTLYLFRTAAS